MINRGEYWQCAYVIPKGGFADLQKQGLDSFREKLAGIAPFIADRVDELADWDRIKLLTVTVDRLKKWYRDGLLCIGDSAHAMSPVGGVGINLAIQDAVAAANKLVPILSSGTGKITTADLAAIQDRRLKPTQKTQAMQVFIQNRFMNRVLTTGEVKLPLPMRVILSTPFLKQMPGRIIALGFLQEHIQTPDILKQLSKAG
jgi:2-polyprenyl-6-methoxyphenol hydroxylase-like FAD-dependent oxidoreductase